jgi:integrase
MPVAARKLALTDRSLKAMKAAPDGRRQVVWDSLMPGMAVRITALGKRSFYAVKRRAGDAQPTWHLLGAYPVMSLSEAREAAREALRALIVGEHPRTLAEEKRQAAEAAAREAGANTFAAMAEAFTRQYLPRLKPRTARIYEGYINRELIPVLGNRPIAEVRRREVIALIEAIAEKSGRGAALNAFSLLRKLLGWALARDVPGYEANPAASIRAADLLGPSRARDRLLSDAELGAVWRAVDAAGQPFGTIYRLLLLLGLRLTEVSHMRWEDLDLDAASPTLTIPSAQAKNREAMLVPLPPLAVALLRNIPRLSGPYVFGSATGGRRPAQNPSAAKRRLDAAIAAKGVEMPAFVIHDFRRCVRSGLGRLGVSSIVGELCLGHRQPGIVGVYDRHSYFDEKREALTRWERHLIGLVSPGGGDNVVALPAARATA